MTYRELPSHVEQSAWAILPSALAAILEAVREIGPSPTQERIAEVKGLIQAVTPRRPRQSTRPSKGVGVVAVHGLLTHRAGLLFGLFSGSSTLRISREVRELADDASIKTIVLDIDSEGGTTEGATELWAEIYRARQKKHVIAVANAMAASGAYWIGSAATEFVATPSGSAGSIGVFHVHADESRALDKAGIKMTLTKAGKHKAEGNPFEPLSRDAKAHIQARVDEAYSMFVWDVAKGRGVKVSDVRNGFGEGRMLGAEGALKLGIVDRIASLEEAIAPLRSGSSGDLQFRQRRAQALAEGGLVGDSDWLRRKRQAEQNAAKTY